MPTVSAGSSVSLTLLESEQLTITTTGGKGSVTVSPNGGTAVSHVFTGSAEVLNVGPMDDGGKVGITAVDAPIVYRSGSGSLATLDSTGTSLVSGDGSVLALSEVTDYVTRTTTGTAFTGACEYAGYVCTVAAGNITVYDNTSAAGTVIVPTTALVLGAYPIFGAGTNGKMALTTGCHVVLSGAATVNVLVG